MENHGFEVQVEATMIVKHGSEAINSRDSCEFRELPYLFRDVGNDAGTDPTLLVLVPGTQDSPSSAATVLILFHG